MKFANVYRVINSSRPALRLAFFSFLCLTLFAVSNARLGVAPAAASASTQTAQQKRTSVGKSGKTGAVSTVQSASGQTATGTAAKGGAKASTSIGVQPSAVCLQNQPITYGQTIDGELTLNDCPNPIPLPNGNSDGTVVDEYLFNGQPGDRIVITMTGLQPAFDTYLYLLSPSGTVLAENDDIGGNPNNINSRISFFLTTGGTHSILANSFAPEQRGTYRLNLTRESSCSTTSINFGETKSGTLAAGDCTNIFDPVEKTSFIEFYTFNGTAGQQVAVTMTRTSGTLSPYLYILLPNGEVISEDGNSNNGATARLPEGGGFSRLPATGTYTIVANTFSGSQSGNYDITLTSAAQPCPSTPITIGSTVNGALAGGDCLLLEDGSLIDTYNFDATANQKVSISMRSTTPGLIPAVFLNMPNATSFLDENKDGEDTARIPIEPGTTFTLPVTGRYTIVANSSPNTSSVSGNYTLTLSSTAQQVCTFTLASSSRDVPSSGGQFTVDVTTQAGCTVTATPNVSWITTSVNNNTVTYTVQQNTVSSARSGTITINDKTFTVNQAALVCTYTLPEKGQTVSSGGGTFNFSVESQPGCPLPQPVSDSSWLLINSFSAGSNGTGTVSFTAQPNNVTTNRTGNITVGPVTYTVTQTSATIPPPSLQFRLATFTVSENEPSKGATITVERTGDTAGTATVEYATIDDPASVPCDPTITQPGGTPFPRGTAYARCDYSTSIDTLTFEARETQKTFTIPLINDVHVEGGETLRIELRNAQGASIGTQSSATLTITDDDTTASSTNPINQSPFFVRMQYLDFLSREPDEGGFNAWVNALNTCPQNIFNGPNTPSQCDRIYVSGEGFFRSVEFQLKGFYIFLYYKASFGSPNNPNYVPQYEQFVPDVRRVTGQTADEVFAKRLKFSTDWVARTEFVNIYASTSNTEFVNRLLANLGISLTSPDPSSGVTRDSLIASLNNGTKQRAEVLRLIVESTEATTVQNNRAFVAIQYYGYLRRTPEAGGYQAWLNVLNDTSLSPQIRTRTMINGFLNSGEYRLRFGPNVVQ
ncbi:MAG TPA: pre-peptidase C-terminal domain-containing protein [Pyrinomonadaceae bacterium]|nr:pre-peptidase C-terminal domain-containing protein [Pyrinomonadaceae bacterium]